MKLYNKKYKFIESFGVFMCDFIAIALSYYIAHLLRMSIPFGPTIESDKEWFPIYALCILSCIFYNLLSDRYEGFFQRKLLVDLGEIIKFDIVQFVFVSACVYLFRLENNFSRILLVYYIVIYSFLGYVLRAILKFYINKFYKKGKSSEKVFVITDTAHLEVVFDSFGKDKGWTYEIVGMALVDCNGAVEAKRIIENSNINQKLKPDFITGKQNLPDEIRQMPIDIVFFYCSPEDYPLGQWIQAFALMGLTCYYCVQSISFSAPCSGVGDFATFPVIYYNGLDRDWRMSFIKRVTDIIGSIIGLVITLLFVIVVGPLIKLEDPKGPIFFSQIRIGKNGRRFRMYKFRSMYSDAERKKTELLDKNELSGPMFKITNDPRITKVGRFLRRTSLDELPQFWNIFKGDMSIVGTRPPTVEEFEQYNDYYRRRMSITPGLTGLWQVSGRSEIKDFNEVVKLDLQYIDHWSVGLDLKILLQTIDVVIKGKGSK